MMRYRAKTIEEKGGIEAHFKELGIDYAYFCELDDASIDNTAIAKLLNKRYPDRPHPIHRTTVKGWREYRKGDAND